MTYEEVLELLLTDDGSHIAEAIEKVGSPAEIGRQYESLVHDLYWKARKMPAVIKVANTALMYCLTRARKSTDRAQADALFHSAKAIACNLAWFCWPGWNEPGIAVGYGDIRAGGDAARLNLRLTQQLQLPPLDLSMGWWLLGAYSLARRQFRQADGEFLQAADFALQAEDRARILMNRGYRAMAQIGLEEPKAKADFDHAIEELEALNSDDSRQFTRQLRVARTVFKI